MEGRREGRREAWAGSVEARGGGVGGGGKGRKRGSPEMGGGKVSDLICDVSGKACGQLLQTVSRKWRQM